MPACMREEFVSLQFNHLVPFSRIRCSNEIFVELIKFGETKIRVINEIFV